MAKIDQFYNAKMKELVRKLVTESVSKEWLKDILLQKKFVASHYGREWDLVSFFDKCIWDNLTEEQQKKVVEALNLIIEEDLYKPVKFGSYYQDLIDIACMIEKKIPGSVNSSLLLKWKNEGFPNLAKPKNYSSSLQAEFTQKIESTFLKK